MLVVLHAQDDLECLSIYFFQITGVLLLADMQLVLVFQVSGPCSTGPRTRPALQTSADSLDMLVALATTHLVALARSLPETGFAKVGRRLSLIALLNVENLMGAVTRMTKVYTA